jgi:hypothetical protein
LLCLARAVDLAFGQTEKKESRVNGETDNPAAQAARKPFDWSVLLTLRSRTVLSGETWLNTFVSAFVALCVGVIAVLCFPAGRGVGRIGSLRSGDVVIGLTFILLD